MEKSSYESPLSSRYASQEMLEIFSPAFKYRTWRKLWTALAEGQKELGLEITDEQVAELKAHCETIDFGKVAAYETRFLHEVMAHLHAYADECPKAGGILHLGATSSFVMDNGDLIQSREALRLIKGKCVLLMEKLNHLALKEVATPGLSTPPFNPPQPM